ncbi:hypothetical protein MC7420_7778 [Coleofasciculus chthonoplastes PCC 7420]|uniref:Uncharacterized protein n=1 Tax=Coleofasciculus chthonoplastes PCC 7420 TaxID=118168 RepID=B4VJA7_9CYAN|nr:hypothetical protein MC7420_7778 [Coleofasciculus chthonoplastes PCC 7420]
MLSLIELPEDTFSRKALPSGVVIGASCPVECQGRVEWDRLKSFSLVLLVLSHW